MFRPSVGCENSNNNNNDKNSYDHPRVVTYGISSNEQTSNFDRNANELQIEHQEQKKRKRETGEYFSMKQEKNLKNFI